MVAKVSFISFELSCCCSLNNGWSLEYCLSLSGVHKSRSFGSQIKVLHNNSIWSNLKDLVVLFKTELAECGERPAFTRKVNGLSIPLALKIGVKLSDSINKVLECESRLINIQIISSNLGSDIAILESDMII